MTKTAGGRVRDTTDRSSCCIRMGLTRRGGEGACRPSLEVGREAARGFGEGVVEGVCGGGLWKGVVEVSCEAELWRGTGEGDWE